MPILTLKVAKSKHIAINSPFCRQYTNLNHEFSVDQYLHPWERTHECSAVTAACLLMSKQDFLSIDGFDEDFEVAYNDVDLCFRARKKYIKIIVEYNGPIEAPIKKDDVLGKMKIFYKDELLKEYKVLAFENIKKVNIFSRIVKSINYLIWGDV